MPNEDFTRGLIQFCTYLLKYKNDYKCFVHQSLSSLLRFVGTDLTAHLLKAINLTTLPITAFQKILFDFLVFFNEDFLNSNSNTHNSSFINISQILDLMIQGEFSIIDVKTSGKVEYVFDTDQIITLTCIQENLKKFSEVPLVNVQSELDQLRQEILELKNNKVNNSNDSSIIIDKFSNLPQNFEDSKRILTQELEKKLVNINHITNYNLYLTNKTVPPSLYFSRFPKPFLPCETDYVTGFNELIVDFQSKAITLSIRFCETKVSLHENNIKKVIEKYANVPNIAELVISMEKTVADTLKDRFLNSVTKINTYQPRGYLVRSKSKPANNASFNNYGSNTPGRNHKRKLDFSDGHTSQQPSYVSNNQYNRYNNHNNGLNNHNNGNNNKRYRPYNNRNNSNNKNNKHQYNNNQNSSNNDNNHQNQDHFQYQPQQHVNKQPLPQRDNSRHNGNSHIRSQDQDFESRSPLYENQFH